jgi:hypothetical protein
MFDKSAGHPQEPLERPPIDAGATRRGRTEAAPVAPAESRLFHGEAQEVDFPVVVPVVVPDARPSRAQSRLLREVFGKAAVGGVEGEEWAKLGRFLTRQYLRRGSGRG